MDFEKSCVLGQHIRGQHSSKDSWPLVLLHYCRSVYFTMNEANLSYPCSHPMSHFCILLCILIHAHMQLRKETGNRNDPTTLGTEHSVHCMNSWWRQGAKAWDFEHWKLAHDPVGSREGNKDEHSGARNEPSVRHGSHFFVLNGLCLWGLLWFTMQHATWCICQNIC